MQLFRLFLQVLLIYYLSPTDLILVFYAVGVSLCLVFSVYNVEIKGFSEINSTDPLLLSSVRFGICIYGRF